MSKHLSGTPATFAAVITPQRAVAAKITGARLRVAADRESLRRQDLLLENSAAHQWFCYCLDAVARRA
jgi:hypothetical protein